MATLSTLCVPGQLLETESWIRDEDGDEKEDASSGGEKCAESGERGSRRSSTPGESVCKGVQIGCTSTGEGDCSGGVGERLVAVDSAVEREEEREGNSGTGRGDRQIRDGETSCEGSSFSGLSCGIDLSGRGGTRSLELKSGHAPGKDGVGEIATIERERKRKRGRRAAFGVKERRSMILFHSRNYDYLVWALQCTFDSARNAFGKVVDVPSV